MESAAAKDKSQDKEAKKDEGVEEPSNSASQWGDIKEKEITPEQIEEMKRLKFIMGAKQQFQNPNLQPFQRK